mgnify:CR=1 FL=1
MKTTALLLLMSLVLIGRATADDPMDSKLAEKAEVVLRVRRLSAGEGSKYLWYEVEILKVLKNSSGETFDKKLKIAAYSWKPGVPEGESTVYLERYNKADKGLWKLVGGEAATGVSHAQKPAEAQPDGGANAATPRRSP